MPPKLPWMPFYGADFFADETVKLCTLRQQGIYLYLLWHQWQEGSIPCLDTCQRFPVFLADPLGTSPDAVHDVEVIHSSCFVKHPTEKGRFYNERLEVIRQEQIEKLEKIHNRAVKGGLAKAHLRQSLSTNQAELKQTLSSANQSQSQIEIKKKSLKSPEKSVVHTVDKSERKIPGEADWQPIQDQLAKIVKPLPS